MSTVFLTGGSGFLGRHIGRRIERRGDRLLAPGSAELDLLDLAQTTAWLQTHRPDVVIHCAAYYGGIGINQTEPANLFFRNTVMGANVFEGAAQSGVKKVIPIGSACAYPGDVHDDMREESFWSGPLHPSVEAYGFSKKAQLVAQRAYHKQYGIESNHLILTNLYGTHDVFTEYRSHVVSALIKKFVEAEDEVVCWGDGSPVREFMYVEDAADAIIACLDIEHSFEPINIGTGIGTSIAELTELIAEITGFDGRIVWDTSKPNGVPRKVLDVTRMKELLELEPRMPLEEGLRLTIRWYTENKAEADQRT